MDDAQPKYSQLSIKSDIRFRYYLAILCMVGMGSINSLKVTFIMAIASHNKFSDDTNTEKYDTILGASYYCAYSLFAIPGGRLGEIYSSKWIIFFGNIVVVFLHLLTPAIIHLDNLYVIVVSRILSGFASGITYPAMIVLMARWSPPDERFILCGIVFGGILFGYAVGIFWTLYVITTTKWENAFYLNGAAFILWLVLHGVYVQDYPRVRKGLSIDEIDYIATSLQGVLYSETEVKRSRVPWKSILKSPPFYAIFFVHVCIQLVFYVTAQRMIDESGTNLWTDAVSRTSEAALMAAPFFWAAIGGLLVGLAFSTLNHRDAISKPAAIRLVTAVSMSTPVVCLTIDYYVHSDWEMLSKPMIIIMMAGMMNMVQANHIEISPNYAGTLMGVTEAFANLTFIVRYIPSTDKRLALGITYAVTAFCALASMLIFVLFLSTEVQPWNWNLDGSKTSTARQSKLCKCCPFEGRKKARTDEDEEEPEMEEEAKESETKGSWLAWFQK